MAKIKNQPHLIPEPAQKASNNRRKIVRGRPVVKQSEEYSTCSDSDFAPRLRQQPKTVKKLSDNESSSDSDFDKRPKIKFKPTVSLPKQPIRRPTKNPTKQPNVSAKLANEPITSTPGPSKRKSEPSQPPNNEPVVISSDESEFEKKPSTSNVNDTAKYTKCTHSPQPGPSRPSINAHHTTPQHVRLAKLAAAKQSQQPFVAFVPLSTSTPIVRRFNSNSNQPPATTTRQLHKSLPNFRKRELESNGQYKRILNSSSDSEPVATKRSKTTEQPQSDESSNINKVPLQFFKSDKNYFGEKRRCYHVNGHGKNNVLLQSTSIYIAIEK